MRKFIVLFAVALFAIAPAPTTQADPENMDPCYFEIHAWQCGGEGGGGSGGSGDPTSACYAEGEYMYIPYTVYCEGDGFTIQSEMRYQCQGGRWRFIDGDDMCNDGWPGEPIN